MILELDQINTFYGETQVLYDVSLAVDCGEVAIWWRDSRQLTWQE